MQFDPDYQKELVGRLCSTSFMKETGHLLRPDMFDPDYAEVIKTSTGVFTRSHKALTKGQLSQLCRQEEVKVSFAGESADGFDRKVVLQYVKTSLMRRAMGQMHIAHEKGQWDKGTKLFLDAHRSFPLAQADQAEDALESSKPMPTRKNLVATGLKQLDSALNGGVAAGDIALVLAPTSGGKTSLLTFLACQAVLRGKKIYYVTLEVARYEIESKMRRCLCNSMEPSKSAWSKISKAIRKKKGRFRIQEHSPHEVGVADLDLEMPRETDLLLVDYADYLRPPSGNMGIEFQDLGTIYSMLKALALQREIPIWTASQVNREAYGKEQIHTQDVDASLRKVMRCDQAISINQSEGEQVLDKKGYCYGNLVVAKNRHGERFKKIPMTIHWGKVVFEEEKMSH